MIERRVIILGSTGSIGTQTVDVVEHLSKLASAEARPGGSPPAGASPESTPVRLRVVGLAAGRNADLLAEQARRLGVKDLALADERAHLDAPAGARVRRGPDSAERLVREVEADVVLAAMVGVSGLPATLAAVELGRDVALANKETLVAAGSLVVPAARTSGSRLLPVDSEHSAIWQCLQACPERAGALGACPPMSTPASVAKITITASGGPFRTRSAADVYHATPAEALAHPTWNMGAKVTVDCASLTNKALEVIEAHWLFDLPGGMIDAVVHPQSIVHALIEFRDGSVVAQLGAPDMKSPIQYALTYPHRPPGAARRLDLRTLGRLEFLPPDLQRFPALGLAWRVIDEGGTSGAAFNAANEEAVEAFLNPERTGTRVLFGQIPELTASVLDAMPVRPVRRLEDVLAADAEARQRVREHLARAKVGV